MTLSGYTVATFGTAQAAAFKAIWAAYLNVASTAVVITNVVNVGGSGRHLSQTGVTVSFTVTWASASAAAAAATASAPFPFSPVRLVYPATGVPCSATCLRHRRPVDADDTRTEDPLETARV